MATSPKQSVLAGAMEMATAEADSNSTSRLTLQLQAARRLSTFASPSCGIHDRSLGPRRKSWGEGRRRRGSRQKAASAPKAATMVQEKRHEIQVHCRGGQCEGLPDSRHRST